LPDHLGIPLEAEFIEYSQHGVISACNAARGIDILDAQQPFALVHACLQITGDSGDQGAQVWVTRR